MAASLKRIPLAIILLLFFVFSFSFRTDFSFDQDLGRHIKLGEIIATTGQVPKTNLFSYTNPDFPFINHHYLFEILLFYGKQSIGLGAILWIKIALLLVSLGLVLSVIPRSSYLLVLPIGFIFLHTLRDRVELRPEILSFLFTALTYFILTRFENTKSKLVYILPVIQFLWVNTHIYFPVGFILQGIFLVHFLSKKDFSRFKILLGVCLLSPLVSLLNPNTFKGLIYPLQVFGNYGYTIAENQSMFLLESLNFKDPDYLFVKLSILIAVISLAVSLVRRNFSLKNSLLVSAGIILALANVRSFPYLALITLPAAVLNFGTIKKSWITISIAGLTIAILLFESFIYLDGDYYRYSDKNTLPKIEYRAQVQKAMDFVLDHNLPQPIFNNFDIGSYIIYRGFPRYKVFVDGRPEAYPASFFQKIYIPMQESPENFAEADKHYNFQTIIFSHTDQTPWAKTFFSFITKDPRWKVVYLDDFMIILVKDEAAQRLGLKAIDLDQIKPDDYSFDNHLSYLRTSIFLFNTENLNSAKAFDEKALSLFPDSPVGNLVMANLANTQNSIFVPPTIQKYLEKSKNPYWW